MSTKVNFLQLYNYIFKYLVFCRRKLIVKGCSFRRCCFLSGLAAFVC